MPVLIRLLPAALAAALLAPAAERALIQDNPEFPEPHQTTLLRVNPPTFRWPAAETGGGYVLELSRSDRFASPTATEAKENFWRPAKPLAAGRWHWRVRPARGAWTEAQSFEIPADLPQWEVPELAQLIARVPKAHPRIFLRPEQVETYRAKAKGPLRDFVRDWARRRESLIGADFTPKASKKEAAPVSGDPEEDKLRAQKMKTWDAKGMSQKLMDPVEDFCWLWLLTGEQRFATEARRRIMIAAALDPETELNDRTSDFANANIVSQGAITYDMLYDQLPTAERAAIRKMLVARAEPIMKKIRRAPGKLFSAHGWQRAYMEAVMGAIAIYGEEPVASEWLATGLQAFVAFYPWYGGLDGGSAEGTNYYTCCNMLSSLNARDFFDTAFGLDFAKGNPWYRANPYYLIYAMPPGGIRSLFGDVNPNRKEETPGPSHRLAALRMASLYNNGYAADYAARLEDAGGEDNRLERFRWTPFAAVKRLSIASLPPARAFRDIGMVFMHSALGNPAQDVRLEFRSSPYGGTGHAHSDQNTFNVIAYDEPLLIDTGYYTSAGDRHHAGWARQTKAHNSILVDGQGQSRSGPPAFGHITRFEQTPEWVYTAGAAPAAYSDVPLSKFDRHLVWLRGKDVETYVIVDDLAAAGGQPHRFSWLLHAANRMQVEGHRIGVRAAKSEARVVLTAPENLTITQTDKFDPPPENWRPNRDSDLRNQWHLTAQSAPAQAMRFHAVIQVGKPGFQGASVTAIDGGVRVGAWTVRLVKDRVVVEKAS